MKQSWPYFAFLILVAVMIYLKLHYLVVLIAAVVLFMRGYLWLCDRYPRTMVFMTSFLMGLLGRGGRRGRW